MIGDFRFYSLLANTADAGPRGPSIRQNPARYAELRGQLMDRVNGTPPDILLDYARYLRRQFWNNTSDRGDLRMYAATRRVYQEFLHCTGIEEGQV